jgi:two-component system, NarL family, nitrate/nitrite response regulator NarL
MHMLESRATEIRILIADHHVMVREGVRRLLESEPGFAVVGEAGDRRELIEHTLELKPDILLFDPEMSPAGVEALPQIISQIGSVRTLLLVDNHGYDSNQVVRGLQFGAKGSILKVSSSKTLIKAIRCVFAGEYWVDRNSLVAWAHSTEQAQSQVTRLGLTPRERQIISEITAGATNRDIAVKLSISEQTAKRHLSNIYNKLGVFNRLELALYAMANNLDASWVPVPAPSIGKSKRGIPGRKKPNQQVASTLEVENETWSARVS